ncbi:MAG: M20/M25/M40 family metallo-hydrolase [Candidatus Heimdallarchaeota archaeon]|nr:M20/M25/M40 family metallo-hydrolase [Candidatus Heimdallarchaeota archaeon]
MREATIHLLSELIAHETSINPENKIFPESSCSDYVKQFGLKHKFEILDVLNGRYGDYEIFSTVLIKRGKKPGKTLLLLGHLDVVPVTLAEMDYWKSEPFQAKLIGDKVFGRGSGDMKGGVVAFLMAFKDYDVKSGNVIIALSGDEEIGGGQSVPHVIDALRNINLLPDYVLNAEGAASPILVTKRRGGTQIACSFSLTKTEIKGKIVENLFSSQQGDNSDTLHSMAFTLGVDTHAMILAGKKLMDQPIQYVHSSSNKINSVPKAVKVFSIDTNSSGVTYYYPELSNIIHAMASVGSISLPINPSKYGPSICPNLIDVNEEKLKGIIQFDIRSMLKTNSHEGIAEALRRHFSYFGVNVTTEIILAMDPVNIDPETAYPQLVKTIADAHDFTIVQSGEKLGGASDTRYFTSLDIPGIELGPISYNIHGPNEAVSIDSIISLTKIYPEIFEALQNLDK